MDYSEIAKQILLNCGNKENISEITHCTTRLRLFIKEKSLVNQDSIKLLEGVIGIVFVNDELQIVLGKNLIPLYNAVLKFYNDDIVSSDSTHSSRLKYLTGYFSKIISFISASVTPMIPGLVACGMLKVFLLLAILTMPPFEKSETYIILSILADVPFYFMPVFVAFGAAKKLGATPIYPMIATAGLIYPSFTKLLNDTSNLTILSMPVMVVKYGSTLLPALLITLCAYYCEKFLAKVIPSLIRPILVGMLTIVISYILGITILGPLGDLLGKYLVTQTSQ